MKKFIKCGIIIIVMIICHGVIYADEVKKVGLVTDVGKVDDKTFNEFAYKGMIRAAKEFGIESAFIETQQPTDYEKNIGRFVSEGFDMIITVGFMLGDATRKMADKNPEIKFVIIDFAFEPPVKNVMGLVFAEDQAGYLAGVLAGSMTKSKTVGVVGGIEIPPVVRFRKGFEAGVKSVCSKCEVLGVFIDSFTDPARGKTAAISQMDEGADVIFGGGGTTGSGAILGAAQAGAWVIGVDQDEYMTTFKQGKAQGSDKILSCAMKHIDNAVYEVIRLGVKGQFSGRTRLFNAENNGIGLSPFHEAENAVPEAVKKKLNEVAEGLKNGKIKTGVE